MGNVISIEGKKALSPYWGRELFMCMIYPKD
jgi:hypothetical protein